MSFDPISIQNLSAAELEQRRRDLVASMAKLPNTFRDAPTATLQELAFITGALRRKTSGPPKEAKPLKATKRPGSGAPAASLDDLDSMF